MTLSSPSQVGADPQIMMATADSGVPVLWSPYPGPMRARLMFRVGQADETLVTRGVTHLAEHLALGALGQPTYEFNGSVSNVVTTFDVAGEPAEIVSHLARLCASLHALPPERLAAEKRILELEEAGSETALDELRRRRYGLRDFGLSSCTQLGLRWLDSAAVQDWSSQVFNAGNAVLWLSGPPPAALQLPLPAGTRYPAPDPAARAITGPTWYAGKERRLSLTALGRRSPELQAAGWWVQRLLHWRLRMIDGQTYSARAEVLTLGRRTGPLPSPCSCPSVSQPNGGVARGAARRKSGGARRREETENSGDPAPVGYGDGYAARRPG